MKVVVAPDKFKGSLTAKEVCVAVEVGIRAVEPDAEVVHVPLADGGEGSLDVLIDTLKLDRVEVEVQDPLFRRTRSGYAVKDNQAYIEMAKASGLQLLSERERSAAKTSTVGVGQLMRDAAERGIEEVYLFVGGSATNDGGIGMLHGLGYRFLSESGKELAPTGESLGKIKTIKDPDAVANFKLTIITDVQNPLLGSTGATRMFGPQKVATDQELGLLESGMYHYHELLKRKLGRDLSRLPGSGAAGGIALSTVGLLGGQIQKGIETVLDVTHFREKVAGADLVITGEGKLDEQTLQGKVVAGVSDLSHLLGIKTIAICGDNKLLPGQQAALRLNKVLTLKHPGLSIHDCIQNAADLIRQRITEYLSNF